MMKFLLFIGTITFCLLSYTKMASIILTHPVSQNVTVLQGQVNMSCKAAQTDEIIYYINNQSGELKLVQDNGFIQQHSHVEDGEITRELVIDLTKEKAGKVFKIYCRLFNTNNGASDTDSNVAFLEIAGALGEPEDLSVETLSDYFRISWTPPPTLDNTNISGYSITIDSRDNYTDTFTYIPQVHVNYSDFSSCDTLNITISGYNGVHGETAELPTLYVPSKPPNGSQLPVCIEVVHESDDGFTFLLNVNVSGLTGQRPTHVSLNISDQLNDLTKYELALVTNDSFIDEILVTNESIRVEKYQGSCYDISYELINPLEVFDNVGNLVRLCFPDGKQNCDIGTSINMPSSTTSVEMTGPISSSLQILPTTSNTTESNDNEGSPGYTVIMIIVISVVVIVVIFLIVMSVIITVVLKNRKKIHQCWKN